MDSLTLDHVFICTEIGAPAADHLIAFGLEEGPPNRHPGQGTANRRFSFDNAMLELVWVYDETEARSDAIRRLGLWERWSRRDLDACPFGIAYQGKPGFATWIYRPPYADVEILVDVDSEDWTKPLRIAFDVPAGSRRFEPSAHRAGLRNITDLRFEQRTMILGFDGETRGENAEFRPGLPLVVSM